MTIDSLANEVPLGSPGRIQSNFLVQRSSYYNANITINHWQLKDLVCRVSGANAAYFPSGTKLCRLQFGRKAGKASSQPTVQTDTSQSISTEAVFESSPRCMKESDGVVVVGGVVSASRISSVHSIGMQHSSISAATSSITHRNAVSSPGAPKGLFGVHVHATNQTIDGRVGTLINNCVTAEKVSNGQFHSLVCNNDQRLYFVDIHGSGAGLSPRAAGTSQVAAAGGGGTPTAVENRDIVVPNFSVNMGVALNHASLSPDHKTVVCVGDSSRIFMLHPEEKMLGSGSGATAAAAITGTRDVIPTQSDCGFSTCWNDSGYQFSACFQEGVCFVYDVRNCTKPLHEIGSTRRQSQNGAFRVCKYSGGTDDLLFVTEHHGRVHIVDTRDFMSHQVVMLPKQLYSYDDDYYNQPIVKNYQDVCEVQSQFGYLSASRRFIAGIDVSRLQHSKFFNYSPGECPKRYPADTSRAAQEESVVDPLVYASYVRNMGAGTYATTDSPSQTSSGRVCSPLTDPFFYLDSELEICGLEVVPGGHRGKRALVIGAEDGIIHWDIDSWKRRCFPSYELA